MLIERILEGYLHDLLGSANFESYTLDLLRHSFVLMSHCREQTRRTVKLLMLQHNSMSVTETAVAGVGLSFSPSSNRTGT